MKKLLLLFLMMVFLAVSLAVVGCGARGGEPAETAPVGVPVEVFAVAPSSIVATVAVSGTVAARDDVPVSAEASGRVEEVPVKVGDRVKEDQVLVRLDDELATLTLRQAEAQLLLAEADLDDAEANFGRAEKLRQNCDISDAEFEASERLAKVARAGFMAADAGRASAARQLRNTEIRSPIDGQVAFVHVEKGELVGAGTPVAQVVNDRFVEIEVGLNEDQVVDVRSGQRAEIRVRALPGEIFAGKVEYVGPRADDRTKTYPVKVVVPNHKRRLRAGMVAGVTVATREFRDATVIERDWVVDRYGEPAVFVAADSTAVVRKITLGRVIGDRVVVTSGLEPGDLVVSVGHEQLTENTRIEIKNQP